MNKKIKTKFILLALVVVTISCSGIAEKVNIQPTENFEGKVFYKAKYVGFKLRDESQFGSNLILFYKNGFIRKEYRNESNNLLSYTIYNPETNTSYNFNTNNDTVFFYHPERFEAIVQTAKTETGELKKEKILGFDCHLIDIQAEDMHYEYYLSDSLKVDAKFINGDGCNFLFENYVILKYRLNLQLTKEVTAFKIEPVKIENSIFQIKTSNKVLIELE